MLWANTATTDVLFTVVAPHLRNPPALAWALTSNPDNAANLDGLAHQKLPSSKYSAVRQMFSDMGLQLQDKPRVVQTEGSSSSSSADVDPGMQGTSGIDC